MYADTNVGHTNDGLNNFINSPGLRLCRCWEMDSDELFPSMQIKMNQLNIVYSSHETVSMRQWWHVVNACRMLR